MEEKIQNFKELRVWQLAMEFADSIYTTAEQFPKKEVYGLASQLTRSAVSVASNLAEGSVRGSRKEFAQFVSVARGSLAEAETQLLIAYRRRYIAEESYRALEATILSLHKMLMKLLQSMRQP